MDYSLSTDCFPGVDIAGGVSYFLWDSTYNDSCDYTYIDGDSKTTQKRNLNEFDIFVRDFTLSINALIPCMKRAMRALFFVSSGTRLSTLLPVIGLKKKSHKSSKNPGMSLKAKQVLPKTIKLHNKEDTVMVNSYKTRITELNAQNANEVCADQITAIKAKCNEDIAATLEAFEVNRRREIEILNAKIEAVEEYKLHLAAQSTGQPPDESTE